jgi:hypothetical protein
MKQTIGLSQFQDAFDAIRPNNFSYEGLQVLFDWIEQQEQDTGTEQELDVIALCCEFSEMTAKEVIESYGYEVEDDGNELNNVVDCLHDDTIVLGLTDTTVVFLNF